MLHGYSAVQISMTTHYGMLYDSYDSNTSISPIEN